MTTRELARQRIEAMSEEELEAFLEVFGTGDDDEFPPLTPEEMTRIDRALEQERQGRVVPHSEVLRRFGRL